jgi:hypothetical protein
MGKRSVPRYPEDEDKGGGCCCCLLGCCCFFFLILLSLFAGVAYLYYAYNPKPPSYSMSNMAISQFEFSSSDLTLYTKLVASVRADISNLPNVI